jgi:hypothetical protein
MNGGAAMKKRLIVLALAILFTGGCNGDKQEAKTQAKRDKQALRQAHTSPVKTLGANKHDVVLFLNRAEHAIEDVYYAAASMPNGKKVREDGVVYRQLPRRFDSKEKIVTYFARYWSRPLAEKMYDNLPTYLVKGKVYLAPPAASYPVLISTRNTRVQRNDTGLLVTVTDVTTSAYAQDRTIRYRLARDEKTKRFEIKSRAGAYGSEQFQ